MRKLSCLFLFLFLVAVAHAQYDCNSDVTLSWGSYISIDPGSGEILGEGITEVTYNSSCISPHLI